jgi:Predicted membrane protein
MTKQKIGYSYRLNRYFRQIKYKLPCSGKTKRKLIQDLRDRVDAMTEEQPGITIEEIVQALGTADQITEEYLSSLDSDELRRKVISSRRVIRILAILITVVIITLVATVAGLILWNHYCANGHYETTEIVYTWPEN